MSLLNSPARSRRSSSVIFASDEPSSNVKRCAERQREILGYINTLVKDGGYLATCSCSHFMDEQLFLQTIREAASLSHRRITRVEFRQQAPDHPVLICGNENSYYLKFVIYQVTEEK